MPLWRCQCLKCTFNSSGPSGLDMANSVRFVAPSLSYVCICRSKSKANMHGLDVVGEIPNNETDECLKQLPICSPSTARVDID